MIILSKLQPPQIKTKTLRRDRLLNLIEKNLDKKLVLLNAGPGYGKTTLLSQLVAGASFPYVFYQLEKGDANPAVFLSYLIAGIRKTNPDFGNKTDKLSHLFNFPGRFVNTIIGTFSNEIIEKISDELYIILEDYHLIEPAVEIESIITYLLDHMPQNLHMIISSRFQPSFATPRMMTRDEFYTLTTDDFKFTKDEIERLFKETCSITLKDSESDWLLEQSEGWPTNLRLVLQILDARADVKPDQVMTDLQSDYQKSRQNIFEYFAQEIFERESDDVKQFLIDCSFLDWLDPELCAVVTGKSDAAEILSGLAKRNAFIVGTTGRDFRFHNLFRDFLHTKLIDASRKVRIYRNAGYFYLRAKKYEEALKLFLYAREYEKAADIIEKISSSLIKQGKSALLCSYIEQIPLPLRKSRPQLLLNHSQSLTFLGRPVEAKKWCRLAVKTRLPRLPKAIKADSIYKLAGIYLNEGNLRLAKKWFIKALAICPTASHLTRASILNSLGSINNALGGKYLKEARAFFERAITIAHNRKYYELETSILNNWAMNEWKSGKLKTARLKLTSMVKLLENHFSPGCGAGFYNAARANLFLGFVTETRTILETGLKLCSEHDDMWSMASLWKGYSLLYEVLGDYKSAREFIVKSLDISEKTGVPWLIISALTALCRINITEGKLLDAERNLKTTWELKKKKTDPDIIPVLILEAQLKIIQTKYEDAKKSLAKALELVIKYEQPVERLQMYIEQARLYHLLKQPELLIKILYEIITLCRQKGLDFLLLNEIKKEQWLISYIIQSSALKKYVWSIVRSHKSNFHILEAQFFGTPTVRIDGEELRDSYWRTRKAKKLFFFLMLQKGDKISQDILIETIWQGIGLREGSNNLRKAIQHIREALRLSAIQQDAAVIVDKGFYSLSPTLYLETDIREFERLTGQLKSIGSDRKKMHILHNKARSVYRNGFAAGWYDDWVEEKRRYYQSLFDKITLKNQ